MSSDTVDLSLTDGVAYITLSRPERKNALSDEMAVGVVNTIDQAVENGARCIVVRGSEGAFSAGGDLEKMTERLEGDQTTAEKVRSLRETTNAAVAAVATCRLPTIAAVDGPAVGAGANLAIACDIVLASETTRIGFGFRNVGLTVDSGTSVLLPRMVGEHVAKELVYTGELVEAERAAELGLVNHIYPSDEFKSEVESFAATIAEGPTAALEFAKHRIERGGGEPLEPALRDEALAQGVAFETRDHAEAVRALEDEQELSFEGH
ncbi:enoyl-CoA hydratase/isomerase family protein [Natrialbaceae archaeon AArc-T1-2]|uniref:enoyl-CoA hydratase/isomerase family protein n=1 Tax=Natrialbaceae archaeon AArc-T1-2 TaxID=3053904 RepID=UPI00255A78BF|nr:enoyl-CoA hydratase-related protein [Natrialbaceae archaeon AArc-T1-2]WIV68722.1 enoyl-CoA hydratase-related protein [Natrialbaceae archaeon AArc-T1-2]